MGQIITYFKKNEQCCSCGKKFDKYFKYEKNNYCSKCYEYLILITDTYEVATF